MKRRTYLVSLAACTGASSIALGTGAFSTANVDREVRIAVSPDDEALLGLEPTGSNSLVRIEDGVLTIDTGVNNAEGINPQSRFTFGSWNETGGEIEVTNPIFQIVNNSVAEQDVEFTYEWDSSAVGDSTLMWYFTWETDGTMDTDDILVSKSDSQDTVVVPGLQVGEAINVAFEINAVDPGDELSGDINLRSSDSNLD